MEQLFFDKLAYFAQLLGYDPAVVSNRLRITTGSGVEYAPQIRIKKIETLNRSLINFPVICHTLPTSANVDGLPGLDFFRKTRLLIDLIDGYVNIVKQ